MICVQALHVTCHAACHPFTGSYKIKCVPVPDIRLVTSRALSSCYRTTGPAPGLCPSISQCKLPLTVNVWPHVHWHREHNHAPCSRVLGGRQPTHREHTRVTCDQLLISPVLRRNHVSQRV